MIEIPKLKISYSILSQCNDENLEISVCKLCGPNPNEIGNLCVAAHNYNNYSFFSKIHNLDNNDFIRIYDISGNYVDYEVYLNSEVNSTDLSVLEPNQKNPREITLLTCDNSNSNIRIVVKAKEKEY